MSIKKEDKTVKYNVTTYDSLSTQMQNPGYDVGVSVEVNSVQLVVIGKIIEGFKEYFTKMDSMKQYLEASAKQGINEVVDILKSSIHVDILIHNPYIILPRNENNEFSKFEIDLGSIRLILNTKDDNLFGDIKISEMNVKCILDIDEKEEYLIEKTNADFNLSVIQEPSTIKIDGKIGKLIGTFNESQFNLLHHFLRENICAESPIKNLNSIEIIETKDLILNQVDLNILSALINIKFDFISLSVKKSQNPEKDIKSAQVDLLEVKVLDFTMLVASSKGSNDMIGLSLSDITLYDKDCTRNTNKFKELLKSPIEKLENNKEDNYCGFPEHHNHNINISIMDNPNTDIVDIVIPQMRIFLIPDACLDIALFFERLGLDFKEDLKILKKKDTQPQKETNIEMALHCSKAEICFIEEPFNPDSRAFLLETMIRLDMIDHFNQTVDIMVHRLKAFKCKMIDCKLSDSNQEGLPILQPVNMRVINQKYRDELVNTKIHLERFFLTFSYQDYLLISSIALMWDR